MLLITPACSSIVHMSDNNLFLALGNYGIKTLVDMSLRVSYSIHQLKVLELIFEGDV